jgi:hypothetical protein
VTYPSRMDSSFIEYRIINRNWKERKEIRINHNVCEFTQKRVWKEEMNVFSAFFIEYLRRKAFTINDYLHFDH